MARADKKGSTYLPPGVRGGSGGGWGWGWGLTSLSGPRLPPLAGGGYAHMAHGDHCASREKPSEIPQIGVSGERCAFPLSTAPADKKGSTAFLPLGECEGVGGYGWGFGWDGDVCPQAIRGAPSSRWAGAEDGALLMAVGDRKGSTYLPSLPGSARRAGLDSAGLPALPALPCGAL